MDLTLDELVMSVLFASLIIVTLFAVVSRFLHWKSEQKLKRMVIVCRLCGHVFMNLENAELTHCDICNAANRRNGNGKLG